MMIILKPENLIAKAQEIWVAAALEAIGRQGRFHVALSGGGTPERLYRSLAQAPRLHDHWGSIRLWFGDERCVAPDDPRSNFRMVQQAGLASGPGVGLERMEGELEPSLAASRYAERLQALPQVQGWPEFDLVMLGLGEDGHIASLFPGSANLSERRKPVSAAYVDKLGVWRLSITLPVIAKARKVLILVTGDNKAPMVAAVLGRKEAAYPASEIAALPQAVWLLDEGAAGLL